MKIVINKRNVDQLPFSKSGSKVYLDTSLSGFGVRIGQKTKTFYAEKRVDGKPVRVTLGRFPVLSVEEARKKAMGVLSELADGKNVNTEKKSQKEERLREKTTLAEALGMFLERRPLKPRTVRDYRGGMERHLSDWLETPLLEITSEMVVQRHRRITKKSGEAQANQVMRGLRSLINFALAHYPEDQLKDMTNPVLALTRTRTWHPSRRRMTVIPKAYLGRWMGTVLEVREMLPTTIGKTICDYLVFCLLTGLRRNEASQLKWENVDLIGGFVTIPDTKNRMPHRLPLSVFLWDMLKRRKLERVNEYVFQSREDGSGYLVTPQKTMNIIAERCGITFCIHDLRRTFASMAEGLGINGYTLKRLLNHRIQQDVTGGYIVAGYDTEGLREPMQRITDFVLNEYHSSKLRPAPSI